MVSRKSLLIMLAVAGLVFFTNLGGPRLWDRDEPRNAGCAAEMLERGDWVTPVFNDELRSHKPVLLYWFMMTAYSVFGVNEFSARFWSAVLGTGSVVLTGFIGQRLFHPRVGLWAAIALGSSLMFGVASRAATPDAVLVFCSTAALAIYVWGNFQPAGTGDSWAPAQLVSSSCFPADWRAILGMYAMMAVGVLAKGPVAVILPMAVIGMFMLIQRWPAGESSESLVDSQAGVTGRSLLAASWRIVRVFHPLHFARTLWVMRPLVAVMMVMLIALPWYVWVGMRTDGAWLRGFLLEHNLHRAMSPMEGHDGAFFYYPLAALVGFFPWSIFAIPMLVCAGRRVRRDQAGQAGYVLVLCWVGVYIGLFSLAQTKLPSYITPCYPGLALVAGSYLFHWTRNASRAAPWWTYASMASLLLVGIAVLVGVPLAAGRYLPGAEWIGGFGLILVAGAVLGTFLISRHRLVAASRTVGVTAVTFTTISLGYVALVVDTHQQADELLQVIDQHHESAVVGALGAMEPSWVYYLGKPIHVLKVEADRSDAVAAPAGRWEPRPLIPVLEFLGEGSDRVVIVTGRAFETIRENLPPEIVPLGEVPYFLKDEKLLVVGHRSVGSFQANRPAVTGTNRR